MTRKNLFVILLCLGIAISAWVLTSLSLEYESTFLAHVSYEHIPTDKEIVNELPSTIKLTVKGKGQQLMWQWLAIQFAPIHLSIKDHIQYGPNGKSGVISSSSLEKITDNALISGLSVTHIIPAEIKLDFDTRLFKKVNVVLDNQLSLKSKFKISGPIVIKPDSITISGVALQIKDINSWTTIPLKLSGVDYDIDQLIALASPTKSSISIKPKSVNLKISIEEFTETRIIIPITKVNIPESIEITLFPQDVEVVFQVALSHFNEINKNMFEVKADFGNFDIMTNKEIPLKISKYPVHVKHLKHIPVKADYIIQKAP